MESLTPQDPPCRWCGKPAALRCLACGKPVCLDHAIPAPTSATTLHDPTDTNDYFCSFRCEEIWIDIHKQ